MSNTSTFSPIRCVDCGNDTRFTGWVDCEDGKKRCLKCWEKWLKEQGIDKQNEHCDDCGNPLIEGIPRFADIDYKIRCVFCHQKKFGVGAS